MKTLFFLLSLFVSTKVLAYPEMVRHHYPNCIACHESPSGGGLLNAYGRGISFSLLSTWGSANEARPFYGAIDNKWMKNWFNAGGDLRGLQLHTNSAQGMMGRFIRMQAGIETAFKVGQVKFVSFFGKQETGHRLVGEFTRYFLMYQPLDELTIRAGRFLPNFGLNVAEHSLPTRKGLGFDQGQERNQVETMWSGENFNSSIALTESVKTDKKKTTEKAGTAQINYTFFDNYKLGTSVWLGKENGKSRQIYGLHGILGITEKLYYLTEFDFQSSFDRKHGLFHFSKLGYEIVKGFHLLGLEDYRKADMTNDKTLVNSYGLGAAFYPRPHFDIEASWNKMRVAAMSSDYMDYAYLMLHFYF
jgi:hypothetical protein